MLPLRNTVLPLYEIAEYWSRELNDVRHSDDIFDELLAGFWLDKLRVTGSGGNNKVDRLAILREVNRRRVHCGFSLTENWADRPYSEPLPSGGIRIDITHYVILPTDDSAWTDGLVAAAYEQMAMLSFDDFDNLIRPGLLALHTTHDAVREFCDMMGYRLPRFWFLADNDRIWNSQRERMAENWFRQVVKGAKEKPRAAYLAAAQKEFPGMPEDAFDRIWRKIAPADWKKPGPVCLGTARSKP
jgi:hypothetical protein